MARQLALTDRGCSSTTLNVSANTVIKASRGYIKQITVITPGTTTGAFYDVATVAGAAASNQLGIIPNAVGDVIAGNNTKLCLNGIVVEPGTGMVIAVEWI